MISAKSQPLSDFFPNLFSIFNSGTQLQFGDRVSCCSVRGFTPRTREFA